jgi:hypothetical protein
MRIRIHFIPFVRIRILIFFNANPDSLYPFGTDPVTHLFWCESGFTLSLWCGSGYWSFLDADPKICGSGSGTLVFPSYLTFPVFGRSWQNFLCIFSPVCCKIKVLIWKSVNISTFQHEMIIAHHSTMVFITLYVKVTGADKDKLFLVSLGALMTLFT